MKINPYEVCIWFFIIIATGIGLIFPISLDTWRTILTVLVIIFIPLYSITHKRKKSERNTFLKFYIIIYIIIVAFEILKAVNVYHYNFYETFYALREYIWILLAFPLYRILIKSKDLDEKLGIITRITLISLGLRALTWFVNTYFNIQLFTGVLYEYGNVWGRNGRQRIDATTLIGVLIPLLFYLYQKKRKKKYLVELAFVFAYLVFVSQTRMLILGYLICIVSMILFQKKASQEKYMIRMLILCIIAVSVVLGAVNLLLNYLDLSQGVMGLGYRFYEFQYFGSLLENGGWKTGIGILSAANSNAAQLLYGNLDTIMYLSDLGMFECFLQFGLFTIFMYGAIYIYMFVLITKCNSTKQYEYSSYIIGQLAYIFVISIPLNLFGVQRSFSVAIILAIVCSISYEIRKGITD